MRSIFLSLVAINVIVLLMQLFMRSPAPAGTDAAPLPKTLEGAQLKMVSEATGGALSEKRSANGASSSSVNSDMCTMVGPYAQLLHAEYLVERLAAMDVHAAINSVE